MFLFATADTKNISMIFQKNAGLREKIQNIYEKTLWSHFEQEISQETFKEACYNLSYLTLY